MKKLWLPFGKIFKRLIKALPPVIKEVEQAMKDGKITASERKHLAMTMIEVICKEWNIKLSWLIKLIISRVIDWLARKLPPRDLKVPEVMFKVLKRW